MALFSVQNVGIQGISTAVPAEKVSNFDLQIIEKKELSKLISTLGIENRRISGPNQCASDLCIAGAEKIIHELQWKKSEISALFFVSQTPDYYVPGSSFHIAERLGLSKSCVTIDINQGCAGYVYGLSLMSAFMSSSKIKKGLLLVGDTITKLVSPKDKSILPVFSDAGTATALEYSTSAPELKFNLSTEGALYEAIILKEGGARTPLTENLQVQLSMKGLDVFNFSLKSVAPNVNELLHHFNINIQTIDNFIFHQANALMLDAIIKKLNLPFEKVPRTLKEFGNTSGASIPLTIAANLRNTSGRVNGDMLLCGFGVGLSLASSLVSFNNAICTEILEV